MSDDVVLTVWVVYYGARNHPPGTWVLRGQDVVRGALEPRPHEIFHECSSLEHARALVPPGLVRFPHQPSEDPTIVESWL